MALDDVFILGAANLEARTRTNKSGKSKTRYTVSVRGDSILVNTDPKTLGKGPAEAIAAVLAERISSIAEAATPATIKARELAAKAFAEGKAWAMKRYGGGRLGAMPPNQTQRAFNDSGRLSKIAVGAQSESYVINFPANRWDPTQVKGGKAGLERIWTRLRELVPELADPRRLLDSIPVRRAIRDATAAAIQVASEKTVELKKQRMRAAIGLVRAAVGLAG